MKKFFTIMVIPDKDKGIKSLRIPQVMFHALIFTSVCFVFLLGVLVFDYWKILKQVYENKHLNLENQQLKEQVQHFSRKIGILAEDIERVQTLEKKLRVITGLEKIPTDKNKSISRDPDSVAESSAHDHEHDHSAPEDLDEQSSLYDQLFDPENMRKNENYNELKELYEQKIATTFGLETSYRFTKDWFELTKQSFSLADDFAEIDYKHGILKKDVRNLEVNIDKIDQHLLDNDSFLKSTPTLLPVKGWVTSYYGPRKSPHSGRVRMHEGVDIGAPIGRTIFAPADGVVTFSGKKPAFGFLVQIDHGYGIETIYAHASKLTVKKGQKVRRGFPIAKIGNSGRSTGPHLHYEVRVNGTPVDPLYYILD